MSTDYEIRCTCGGEYEHRFEVEGWRRPEQVASLIGMRAEFAAIGKKSAAADMWLNGWDAQGSMFPRIFSFFAAHEGHELRVFDEYGERWPREVKP